MLGKGVSLEKPDKSRPKGRTIKPTETRELQLGAKGQKSLAALGERRSGRPPVSRNKATQVGIVVRLQGNGNNQALESVGDGGHLDQKTYPRQYLTQKMGRTLIVNNFYATSSTLRWVWNDCLHNFLWPTRIYAYVWKYL